ncbi:Acyl-CoA synthetase (AMP-forming)/AMP-acid ligase II [Paramicrobacterium humi]|uniref:Acyl-CoA synthetase (AMP-forming)/AMP-acid ligase II n=1 Tax=Paramicrobacterium humi TaxID=640635 RepID=A0A1H4T0M8_9MICO|nr:AMP-binding protein [Microbacterium humi]SEC49982.1 Acyl-CoA synthetase (AMP-forming)/AMP-acid ligase II [Microbacterium humi]
MTHTGNSEYDPSELKRVFESRFTWAASFERNTHRFASRPALSDPPSGRRWTYAELGQTTGRLVEGLRSRQVGTGDIICYQLKNTPEFAFLYIAAQGLRAVSSPMNFRLAPAETAYILDRAKPTVFVYDGDDAVNVSKALELSSHSPRILAAVGGELLDGAVRFEDLFSSDAASFRAPDDASTWDETSRLYTSGTTGMPKAVPLASLNEVLTAHDVTMHLPLGPNDKTMNMSPWFHRGGNYCAGPNTAFFVGAEVVTLPQFDAGVVLDRVQEYKLTYVIGAPTNLGQLADAQEAQPRELSSLHGIVTMGAPLDRAAALRYQRVLTPRIANGYGTTEAFWNTYLRPDDLPDAAGAAGRACLDDDVAVVKVHKDRISPPDEHAKKDGQEIGEVIMRSTKSGYAYLGNPTEQAEKFRDGWVYPGDLATWDENEIVTIVGRKDDMIISGGENVHPVQVEEVLASHDGVADSIVVGLPDEKWGELVVAYVRRKDGRLQDDAAAARELDEFVHSSVAVADYKRPRRYTFVDELPYTATGKKQHYKLKEQAPEDAAAGRFFHP